MKVKKKDPKRIKRILKMIEKIWEKRPYLRLFQLLGNCFIAQDNYYIEDSVLEKRLKMLYKDEIKK